MRVTEPRHSHGLRLTPTGSAANKINPSGGGSMVSSAVNFLLRNDGAVCATVVVVLEGALTVSPVVVSVLGLEIFHESPVVASVAARELFHSAEAPSDDLAPG